MTKIRVALIEDNRLLREGLSAMLREQRDITVVASSGNGDAMTDAKRLKPHVVLLDVGLRTHSSLRMVATFKKNAPDVKIIIMDLAPVQADLMDYVKVGVSGFVLKDATFDDFIRTIRSVARGGKVLPPLLTGSLFTQIVEHAALREDRNAFKSVKMTKREREVVDLIAEGLSNKEIAARLNLATDTVKSHVHNILEKLALHTRLEIANFAHTSGDMDPFPR